MIWRRFAGFRPGNVAYRAVVSSIAVVLSAWKTDRLYPRMCRGRPIALPCPFKTLSLVVAQVACSLLDADLVNGGAGTSM